MSKCGTLRGRSDAVPSLAASPGFLLASGGTSPYCKLVERPGVYSDPSPGNFPTKVYNLSQNVAHIYAEGVDFEVNYGTDLQDVDADLNGFLNICLLRTHQPTMKNQSLPGAVVTNAAGTTADPSDKATLILAPISMPSPST